MAIKHTRVTVGTTATPLLQADTDKIPGGEVLVRNTSGMASIYVGGAGVTTASTTLRLVLADTDLQLYGVVALGTVDAQVLQTGA